MVIFLAWLFLMLHRFPGWESSHAARILLLPWLAEQQLQSTLLSSAGLQLPVSMCVSSG